MARHHLQPVYDFCVSFYAMHKRAPTSKEIAAACDITVHTATRTVWLLHGMGKLYQHIPVKAAEGL